MNGVPNVVVIPTADQSSLLASLVNDLLGQDEVELIVVFDNSDLQRVHHYLPADYDNRVLVVGAAGERIYRMWNRGWQRALTYLPQQEVNVAFLNDDIAIPDRFLSTLSDHLRAKDDRGIAGADYHRRLANGIGDLKWKKVNGSYKDGGVGGWAFMVKGEWHETRDVPFVDEQFLWWCGDDDLFIQFGDAGGELGIVKGLPVDHIGEATSRHFPELHNIKWKDVERFQKKYGKW